MKLRQKLAAVLAASMLMTTVPVITMAQSKNALTTGVVVSTKDASITAATLVIQPDGITSAFADNQTFFVNIQNAEWLTAAGEVTFGGVAPDGTDTIVHVNDKHQLQVTLKNASLANGDTINIPLKVKLTGGEATVAIDSNGSEINEMAPVIFARTNEAKASVSAADAKTINYSGAIANITIQEAVKNTLKTDWITVTLDNTDYEFVSTPSALEVKLSGGFGTANSVTLDDSVYGVDNGQVKIKLSAASSVAPGRIVLEGLQIRAKDRNVAVGEDISVTVSGEHIDDATVKVAKSVSLGNSIEMKDSKPVEITAGKKGKVTFSIKENVNDSIIENRTTIVTLDKG